MRGLWHSQAWSQTRLVFFLQLFSSKHKSGPSDEPTLRHTSRLQGGKPALTALLSLPVQQLSWPWSRACGAPSRLDAGVPPQPFSKLHQKTPETVCIPSRRQLAVFDFETSNSLVFARILSQANQLIGVKYSETLHIPLLLMKRPQPAAGLHTQSTHRSLPLRHAQSYKLRKSRRLQLVQWVFKSTRALWSLWMHGARELQYFITEPDLGGFIWFSASCLWDGVWQERAASCRDLLHYSRTLQSRHSHGEGLGVQVAVSNNWHQTITLACNY